MSGLDWNEQWGRFPRIRRASLAPYFKIWKHKILPRVPHCWKELILKWTRGHHPGWAVTIVATRSHESPSPLPEDATVSPIPNQIIYITPNVLPLPQQQMEATMAEQQECSTPRRRECQIMVAECPPAPRKKPFSYGKKLAPPKNGYFQPPDLELVFTMAPRRQACA